MASGFGLSLASKIVELHEGTIAAGSAGPGFGSEFTVRLPVSHPPAPARTPRSSIRPGQPAEGRRILVVDDNLDAADGLVLLLSLDGYEARAAYTGLQAINGR